MRKVIEIQRAAKVCVASLVDIEVHLLDAGGRIFAAGVMKPARAKRIGRALILAARRRTKRKRKT